MKTEKVKVYLALLAAVCVSACTQQQLPLGRWDITVFKGKKTYPSWLEISDTNGVLTARFVGRVGSVRPVPSIVYRENTLVFSLPVQWEKQKGDMEFSAGFNDARLEGTTYDEKGNTLKFEGVKAPQLECKDDPVWGAEIDLLETEWYVRNPDSSNGWNLQDGILENTPPSTDLITRSRYNDFMLTADIYLPEKSNSGIYLRGRYEVQLANMPSGRTGNTGIMGAVYGFIAPDTVFNTPGDRWYALEIVLLGRCVSIRLNDILIIDHEEIPGITGGALDSREGESGPIMLQGDHGPVKFRNLKLRQVISVKS